MTFTCANEAPGNATAASTTKTAVMRPRFRRSKSAFSLTLHLLDKPQRTVMIALHQQRLKVDYRLGHRLEETMPKGPPVSRFAISTVLLLGLLFGNSAFAAAGGKSNEIGSMGPAPKAQCGPSNRTESGLQGQTTSGERASGDSKLGYNCNLELVGQFRGEGAFSQDGPPYFDHCAYMATENNPRQAHPGIVVIDVSDPKNPQATAYLANTPAGLSPHENNKVNEKRGLLGLAQSDGPNFAVYDLNGDCAHPRLASSITVPNGFGHMGGWADDGKTYYIGQQ